MKNFALARVTEMSSDQPGAPEEGDGGDSRPGRSPTRSQLPTRISKRIRSRGLMTRRKAAAKAAQSEVLFVPLGVPLPSL